MLLELRIRNLAIIEELSLSLSKGLNVLTGETGTGKSIILNAIHLLLGDKAKDEEIRSSVEEASVEGLFDISANGRIKEKVREKTAKHRGTEEEDLLLVSRVLSRSGRGRALLNGSLATMGMLQEIGEGLLSLCGQHEHQSLQRVESHIDILDEFGELTGLRKNLQERYEEFLSLSEEVNELRLERERMARERDLMAFQAREISESALETGEEEALREEKRILAHARKLMTFAEFAEGLLTADEGSARERIQTLLRQGREMTAIDPSLSPFLAGLESVSVQIEDVALELRNYSKRLEIDPARLEEIENRLDEIDRLKRKYGPTVEAVLGFKEKISATLASLAGRDERLERLELRLKPLQEEAVSLSEKLSGERRRVAAELKKAVERELSSLGMKKTVFDVRREDAPLSSRGTDRVEFLLSPNVGEEAKPLAKIASGGELSRIMLAIKRILARVEGAEVLIFDEVDAGIGGAVAEVVGRKLKELARRHQVICVTHLPQIACFADTHFSVRKGIRGGRTLTQVEKLEREAAVNEIARMLGGVKVTEKTFAHAREMLENAQKM